MLTGMRMLILGQLRQNIRSLASFGVIKICGVLFRWSLSGVLKWQQSALLSCVCVSGVAGARRLAMLPNEKRASVMDGAIGIVVIKRKGDLDRRQSWGRAERRVDPQLKGEGGGR